jgi:flagellar basal-body rod protein FlgB
MDASSVTQLLFQQLNYRSERQKVISSNIANIDTPNYKTKDLKFSDYMNKPKDEYQLKMTLTNKSHMVPHDTLNQPFEMYEVEGLKEQNDGNNVNLDTQMSEMSKNAVMFEALKNSIKKDASWFKLVVDASSRN